MTGLFEMWHIVKKDTRQSRWLLLAYLALVITATLGAISRERLLDGNLQWAAGLLLVLGPVIAASLVQADSPTQADAFWAAHPFRRWAMLGAKLTLVIGLLLAVPLIGQFLGLIAFKVPRSDLLIAMRASLVFYGLVFLIAVFIGALTPDLRGFVLGIIAFLAAMAAVSIFASELSWSWNPTASAIALSLVFAGIIGLLIAVYLRRGLRYARSAGVAALALLLITSAQPSGQSAPKKIANVASGSAGAAALVMELRDTAMISRSGVANLRLTLADAVDGRHYQLDDSHVRFFLHDGGSLAPPLRHSVPGTLMVGTVTIPSVRTLRWTDDDQFGHPAVGVSVELTDEERSTLMRGVDSARMVATMTVLEPRVLAVLPLHVGAHALKDGYDVTIERVAFGSAPDVVEVAVKTVAGVRSGYDWMDGNNGFFAVVVNPARSEGIGLARSGASANPGLLVLPGAGLRQGTIKYRKPSRRAADATMLDQAFLQGATLMLMRWQPIAQYDVQASSVPLPPLDAQGGPRPGRRVLEADLHPMQIFRGKANP